VRKRLVVQVYATVCAGVLGFLALLLLVRVAELAGWMPGPLLGWLGHSVVGLVVLALAAAVATFPLVRSTTSRLERLRAEVDALGRGDVWTRVSVEGSDEVADLALALNRASERTSGLIAAQRQLLASVSHSLRSPLARLRLGAELLAADPGDAAARDELQKNVEELDYLIDELLLAGRLETARGDDRFEDVDLRDLFATEAARVGARVDGGPVPSRGDVRLLRRLARNLLENARQHGGEGGIEASVERLGPDRVRITVSDDGPGVPEAERERIFEPFYRLGAGPGEEGGLGLFLVRQIARRHGGDVCCLPGPVRGSRFVVELPGRTV
jgi:signal transduction histidine kinase